MFRAIALSVLAIGIPLGALGLFLAYLTRRRYETRMLRKDPLILAQQGRLPRDAAERLVDMRDRLKRGEVRLALAVKSLQKACDDEFFDLLPSSLTEKITNARDELLEHTRETRKIIEK